MSRLGETVVGYFLTHEIIFATILLYLVLSTFCTCSLAAIYGGFFFWPIDCVSVDFFQLVYQGWPFLFFPIYIYIFFSPRQWFVVYFYLRITGGFFPYRKYYYSVSYLIYIYIYIYLIIYQPRLESRPYPIKCLLPHLPHYYSTYFRKQNCLYSVVLYP